MKVSYEEIGNWAATFACSAMTEGHVAKTSASGTVSECGDGDDFCGVAAAVALSGDACTVTLGGVVKVAYTGTEPTVGYGILVGNGAGGVKVASTGISRWIIAVDTANQTVTMRL